MTNVAETGLVAGLAQLTRALEARKAELLAELRKLERDTEATERTIDKAGRVGFRSAVVPTRAPRRSDAAAYPPAIDAAQPAQAPTPDSCRRRRGRQKACGKRPPTSQPMDLSSTL